MIKMTKKELIQLFLNELEQNNVLKRVRTKEEINEKLNQIITDVEYEIIVDSNRGAKFVFYISSSNGKIIIDIDKINSLLMSEKVESTLVVHEIIHALVAEFKIEHNRFYYKTGLQTVITDMKDDDFIKYEYNRAIAEGMTDTLAMKITGTELVGGYEEERELYKLCSIIIGEDTMIDKYCDKDISKYFNCNPYDIFLKEIIGKYGVIHGEVIATGIERILALSDELLIRKYKNELELYED